MPTGLFYFTNIAPKCLLGFPTLTILLQNAYWASLLSQYCFRMPTRLPYSHNIASECLLGFPTQPILLQNAYWASLFPQYSFKMPTQFPYILKIASECPLSIPSHCFSNIYWWHFLLSSFYCESVYSLIFISRKQDCQLISYYLSNPFKLRLFFINKLM